ncbi:ribosomal protection-like ABC-F family protein [Cytobacillus horneckiae]|uniref:ribosomal protection-like ABC-F family protein n=1 Tax=Cytobacillus horneckiae TaxID=549687 RepID=UPI0039A004CA
METLNLELNEVEVTYLNRVILNIPKLTVYQNDRIGIVGANGQGKTTLLDLINGRIKPNSGNVNRVVSFNYYEQIKQANASLNADLLDAKLLGRMKVPLNSVETLSGGEQTRLRLAQVLSKYELGLIMDEPTTHLDADAINYLIDELRYYYGTLILVSHDRYFLDHLVTKIWEVNNGTVHEYEGNYSDYSEQKKLAALEKQRNHENYLTEKKRLERSAEKKLLQVQKMSQVSVKKQKRSIKPDRLSASKSKDSVQKAAQKTVKSIEKRIDQLEEVSPMQKQQQIHFPLSRNLAIHNKYPVMGQDISLMRGNKVLLNRANFQFPLGKVISITGNNGTGKSTLLNYILQDGEGIVLSPKVVFGQYHQMDYKFFNRVSIIEYLQKFTDYSESTIRAVLSNIGFRQTDLGKIVSDISGGEATRLVLARLFLQPSNVLILDEPTNFIDVLTIEALEEFIKKYEGTVIFTSHDRYFTEKIADQVWKIDNEKLVLIYDR